MGEVAELPKVQNYRDLLAWQQGIQLVKLIYQLTQHFPKEEIYGLTSQIRRCAVSIPSNIAEGHARDSLKSITAGSTAELQTQLIIAKELGLAPLENFDKAELLSDKTLKMLRSLQRTLKSKL